MSEIDEQWKGIKLMDECDDGGKEPNFVFMIKTGIHEVKCQEYPGITNLRLFVCFFATWDVKDAPRM